MSTSSTLNGYVIEQSHSKGANYSETYVLTLRIFVSHENESFVTKTLEVEMAHCNLLLAMYVIAQLHSSSVQRRSTNLYNIKWYSEWPVAKGSPRLVLYFCCSQRSESTYPPPPPNRTYTKMTDFSPHLFSVQHSRLYPCHLYFLRYLIN